MDTLCRSHIGRAAYLRGFRNHLVIDAESPGGEVMAISHANRPIFGVQFHPESILSESGHALLENFLRLAGLKAIA